MADTSTEHVSLLQSSPEYARQEWEQFGPDAVLAISMSDLSGLVADALSKELNEASQSGELVNDLDYTELGITVASFIAGRMGAV